VPCQFRTSAKTSVFHGFRRYSSGAGRSRASPAQRALYTCCSARFTQLYTRKLPHPRVPGRQAAEGPGNGAPHRSSRQTAPDDAMARRRKENRRALVGPAGEMVGPRFAAARVSGFVVYCVVRLALTAMADWMMLLLPLFCCTVMMPAAWLNAPLLMVFTRPGSSTGA